MRVYRVRLTGAAARPKGAPAGAGAAVIALHHHAVVCYRFAHLHGFSTPTSAELAEGAPGSRGKVVLELSRGSRLRHRGCVRASRVLGAALEKTASRFFVQILSHRYPEGAVRGQL